MKEFVVQKDRESVLVSGDLMWWILARESVRVLGDLEAAERRKVLGRKYFGVQRERITEKEGLKTELGKGRLEGKGTREEKMPVGKKLLEQNGGAEKEKGRRQREISDDTPVEVFLLEGSISTYVCCRPLLHLHYPIFIHHFLLDFKFLLDAWVWNDGDHIFVCIDTRLLI